MFQRVKRIFKEKGGNECDKILSISNFQNYALSISN